MMFGCQARQSVRSTIDNDDPLRSHWQQCSACWSSGVRLYAAASQAGEARLRRWLGASERPAEAKLAHRRLADLHHHGIDGIGRRLGATRSRFHGGKKALRAEDWNGAIAALELAALRDPSNADIQNYIGYAYRRLRQLGPAMQHYQQALMLNPRHRSAHEHLGELYLVLGEPAKAQQQLATLENICLIPCEEYDDLKRAIAAYKTLATR